MIQQIVNATDDIHRLPHLNRVKHKAQRIAKTGPSFSDFLTLSPQPQDKPSEIRQDLVSAVKARMKAGFYNSAEVVDDLSDSFAKAFNLRT